MPLLHGCVLLQVLSAVQSEKKSLANKLAILEKELQGSREGANTAAEKSQAAAAKEIASLKTLQGELQRQVEELQAR